MQKPANHKTGRQNIIVCIEMCIELHSPKLPKQALSYTRRYTRSQSSGSQGFFTIMIIYVIKMLITFTLRGLSGPWHGPRNTLRSGDPR